MQELADIRVDSGASFIYREDNSRYIGVQYSIEGSRPRGRGRGRATRRSRGAVRLPAGLPLVWGGEYEEYTASRKQLQVIVPRDAAR